MPPMYSKMEKAPRETIRDIQFQKLKEVLRIAGRGNQFYRRKFQEHGLVLDDIRSLDDLDKLPFSYKIEFQKDQEENPPFGTNLSEPLKNYVHYHQTTGTTGRPLKWLDTNQSWQWRGKTAAMALYGAGVLPSDIVFFPFAFGPHVAFWGLFEGIRQIGALAIAGGGWSTLQRIESILENNATVICCTPTYALRMAEIADKNALNIKESSVRTMIHAGEPGALIPAIRNKIKATWGATPFDYPGLTEVGAYAIHCLHQDRSIHVNESEFIVEIIDPDSEKQVAVGEVGEMVLTNLGRSCSPGIRFRTNDLVKLKECQCQCGRTFRILEGGVLGRSDDMIVLRGMNLFPSKIGEIVEKYTIIGEEYQMVADTKDGIGEFEVRIEFAEGREKEEICSTIKEEIRRQFEIRVKVESVPAGTLPRPDYKSKRFTSRSLNTF
jgi:phenylacetate-CoA ligase